MFNRKTFARCLAALTALFFVLFLFLIVCEEADARAGGGHSYSSGSRPSSSSGSYRSSGGSYRSSGSRSGGSSSADIGIIIFTVIIVIIIAAFKAFMADHIDSLPGIFRLFLSRDDEMTSAIREATQNQPVRSKRVSLAPLKAKDPDFDEAFWFIRFLHTFKKKDLKKRGHECQGR